ncbi:hypothetical protein Gpo141_00013324 [Globisporangium polare]
MPAVRQRSRAKNSAHGAGAVIDITMRLCVTAEVFNVLCYKTSRLTDAVSGKLLPSETFLKQIKFNESAELTSIVNIEYNLRGLDLLPRAVVTDCQVNAR